MGIKCLVILFILTGCAQGHCRRTAEPPTSAKPVDSPTEAATLAEASMNAKPTTSDRVIVYKYDGSLQCGKGKGIASEVMAKDLGAITIYGQTKKSDGQAHIQVCGSPTGQVNTFEIPAKSLPAAEKRGFKKWSFE